MVYFISLAMFLFLCADFYCVSNGFHIKSFTSQPRTVSLYHRGFPSLPKLHSSIYDRDLSVGDNTEFIQSLKKWYFLQKNIRAEIYFSDAVNIQAIFAELWKGTLITTNIQEEDKFNTIQTNVYVFPNVKLSQPDELRPYNALAKDIMSYMNESSPMFKKYRRKYEFVLKPMESSDSKSQPQNILILAITSARSQQAYVDLGNWNVDDNTLNNPAKVEEKFISNEIKSFPFPTIFDFISEINRPVDITSKIPTNPNAPVYNFRVKDLKYDTKKMSKKVDPQEFIDVINCRLNRLAMWRNVLDREQPELREMYSTDVDWAEGVYKKYQSLQSLVKTNPKRALETQYDKRKVFMTIIDRWSDRLKRHFKHFYHRRSNAPQDFFGNILESKWRTDLVNNTKIFSQIPSLMFQGPELKPGAPEPIFTEDRVVLWTKEYDVEIVLYEMMVWLDQMKDVLKYTYSNDFEQLTEPHEMHIYDSISQQVFSRGESTEQVMYDTWTAIARWIEKSEDREFSKSSAGKPLDINRLMFTYHEYKPSTGPLYHPDDNHMEDYFSTIRQFNEFSRKESNIKASSVKGLYQKYAEESAKAIEWWTNLVRNLDMFDELESVAYKRTPDTLWSDIMRRFIEHKILNRYHGEYEPDPHPWYVSSNGASDVKGSLQTISTSNDQTVPLNLDTFLGVNPDKEYEEVTKAVDIDIHVQEWKKYSGIFLAADYLNSILPWNPVNKDKSSSNDTPAASRSSFSSDDDGKNVYVLPVLNEITKHIKQLNDNEAITVDCVIDKYNPLEGQLLVVFPRYFRGSGMEQELSAFLEFARMVESDIQKTGIRVKVTPLHPLMVDVTTNQPAYARRSPHPALIFSHDI